MAKQLNLPIDEFEQEFKKQRLEYAGNPVYNVFFPALGKSRQASARADVRRALFSAALAVQLDGQAALKNHRDPAGSGPFDFTSFKQGFELRSKLKGSDDKPIALSVGSRD